MLFTKLEIPTIYLGGFTYTIYYRIVYRMKVTALIPDNIIKELKQFAGGRTLTESLIIALTEWISLKKIKKLNHLVEDHPLNFQEGVSAAQIRSANRKR